MYCYVRADVFYSLNLKVYLFIRHDVMMYAATCATFAKCINIII